MDVTVLVGNPTPNSRTRTVAEALARRVADAAGGSSGETIDLCEYAGDLFTREHPEIDSLRDRVASAGLLVVASPTYKATYTGLLKAFLDGYETNGLAGVTAVPMMTGGAPQHSLAVDTGLRCLLVELGASVPTRGLYFLTERFDRLDEVVDSWAATWLTSTGPLGAARRPAG